MAPPTQLARYKSILFDFMLYHSGVSYPNDQILFPPQVILAAITPEDIVKWMKNKAYGKADIQPADSPELARSCTLMYYKKALSWYMPNKHIPWNELTNEGNPTKSSKVNELISDLKLAEVRHRGAPPKTRRPLETEELEQLVTLLEENDDANIRYMVPAAVKFLVSMISRIDDTAEFLKADMSAHNRFDFALADKMCWSKNIREERDSPTQIMLGAVDHRYCVLLALAIYMETRSDSTNDNYPFLFGNSSTAEMIRNNLSRKIRSVFASEQFIRVKAGLIGTHSLRKYAATLAKLMGCSDDEIEARGRWKKGGSRVVTRYIDVTLPYQDAKVAAALCVGGPVKYVLRAGSGITSMFLKQYVVPQITSSTQINKGVEEILALPLLWAAFNTSVLMPTVLRERIVTAYNSVPNHLEVCPVEKIPLFILQNNGRLDIQAMSLLEMSGTNTTVVSHDMERGARRSDSTVIMQSIAQALFAQNVDVVRHLSEVKSETKVLTISQKEEISKLRQSIDRLRPTGFFRPRQIQTQQVSAVTNEPNQTPVVNNRPASLTKNPKSLNVLWNEYMYGIGGNKPAKEFTEIERGLVATQYCRRLKIWSEINSRIRSGVTAEVAIDDMYEKYGSNCTITEIINSITEEQKSRKRSREAS